MLNRNSKKRWKSLGAEALVLLLSAGLLSQTAWSADGPEAPPTSDASAGAPTAPAKADISPSQDDFEQLKSLLQAQSDELQQLSRELKEEQAKTQALEDKLNAHDAASNALAAAPVVPQPVIGPLAGLPTSAAPATPASSEPNSQSQTPTNVVAPENPLSIKIGGADFTPGGFVDLTGIFRSTNDGTSGLSTNLTSIPFNNTLPAGALSEFRFTSQGSRLSLKVDANVTESTKVTGYVESDFNGYEPANADSSTKSDTFRLRVAWVQIRRGKWEFLTGQTWSLLTPTRIGLSPASENIFTALRVDSSYLAGMVYSRQPSARFAYHPTQWATFAVALENPDQFVPSSVVFPTDGSTNYFSTQFDNGSSSTSATSATSNVAAPNLRPDVVAKTSLDWKLGGKAFHVDLGAVTRSFKDYNNLITPHATNTITEGAGQADVNFEVAKNFHLIGNSFYGEGGGRYIGALGPDVIVKANGQLSPVRSGSAVFGYEWQTSPKLIIDSYYSGAYFWRNYQTTTSALGAACGTPNTYCVGFGFPGSANTNNKAYQEASIGLVPTIWSNPNYGRLQFISQFSYVTRAPWYVAGGSPKNAHEFISFVDLRYIFP